ncbi:MAG TPA: arginine--tRNA ligase [Bacteroidetes bacterium]|nr:arginine--tRNA ligase [Bacteroidota bacterium]
MNITDLIQKGVIAGIKQLYGADIAPERITMNITRKEFEGDYTVVTFPFTKIAKKKPDEIATELGHFMVSNVAEIEKFNVVKGFLNLSISPVFWKNFLLETAGNPRFGQQEKNGRRVMIEFCSPNTNKPLHLGHVRNILLGWSCSKIYEAAGFEVIKVQVINDRGIAICKSMLAWEKFAPKGQAEGATPESTGKKSDHFVGDYYVLFEKKFQEEYKAWQQSDIADAIFQEKKGAIKEVSEIKAEAMAKALFFKNFYKNTYFNEYSILGKEAREMLMKWEAKDPATIALWKKMNQWVYDGFEETFKKLGVSFDKYYYESETYLLGKDAVEEGLEKGVFYKKEDGSVWADLTGAKLDHKVVLRSDGTSVYITQDIGTAQVRYKDFAPEKMVYVVADEQDYHFKALFEILKRLGEPYADGLYHLNYGMVDLPSGKMKSREGTVVDADDLIAEVIAEATKESEARGEISSFSETEKADIIQRVALGALKFQIIKVQPKKRMVFDPAESVEMQGHTGPYVQYANVRANSILKKAEAMGMKRPAWKEVAGAYVSLKKEEKDIVGLLYRFPETIRFAAETYDPSAIAAYCYDLAKNFSKLVAELSILKAETEEAKAFRLEICAAVSNTLTAGMGLLGIEMPERM